MQGCSEGRSSQSGCQRATQQLESVYYDQVFQCEMAVTARVSHPNLLHFHGAKLEGTRDDYSDRVHAHQPQS